MDVNEKISGLVSLVKLPNVIVLLAAQLLAAHYVFVPHESFWTLLWHHKFIFMLLATGSAISAGYIINHFYNIRRDWINRPQQSLLERELSMSKKLYLYFFLNFLTLVLAAFISWRAMIFFAVYIFLIWIYFHKIQSRPFWREIGVTFLTAYPFFGVMLFFKAWNPFVIWAGVLFILLLLMKESVKNHLTLRGDVAGNIKTVLVEKGEKFQSRMFYSLAAMVIIVLLLAVKLHLPSRFIYFLYLFFVMLIIECLLYYRKNYIMAYRFIKLIIISGVFALFLL